MQKKLISNVFILVFLLLFSKHLFSEKYKNPYVGVSGEDIESAILSVNLVLKKNGFSNLCLSIKGGECIKVEIIDIENEKVSLATAVYGERKIKIFPVNIQKFIEGFPEEIPMVDYDRIRTIKGTEKWKEIEKIADMGMVQLLNSGLRRYVRENKVNLLKIIMLHEVGHINSKHGESGFSAYESKGERYRKEYYEELKKREERVKQEEEADSFVAKVIKKNAKFDREKPPVHCLKTQSLPPKEMVKCLKYMDEESQIHATIGMLINAYNARRNEHYRKYNCPELATWDLPVDYLDYSPVYSHSLLRLITIAKEVAEEGSLERKALEYRLRDLLYLNDYKNSKEYGLKKLFVKSLSFRSPSNLDSFEVIDDIGMDKDGVFSAMREELGIGSEMISFGKVQKCMFYEIITRCEVPLKVLGGLGFYEEEVSDFKSSYEGENECLKVLSLK